jgi:hypothetical protein
VIVIDEYLAISVVGGDWPEGLPGSEGLLLPPIRHWRLLQRLRSPGTGQISRALSLLSPAGRDGIRFPHPEVLQILDSRPLLDEAAQLAARHGGGWLVAETLAAGLTFGRATEANVNLSRIVTGAAGTLGIQVHVLAA